MIHKYECTMAACGAEITLDDEKKSQDIVYPKGHGPLEPNYRAHNCPAKAMMFPIAETIDKHPMARKVR